MVTFILARMKEPSTWRGLVVLASGLGIALNPEQVAAISALGMSLAGTIGVFTSDPKKK
jgi:hypothetical protein